jgi:hypothetical protein
MLILLFFGLREKFDMVLGQLVATLVCVFIYVSFTLPNEWYLIKQELLYLRTSGKTLSLL